MTRWLVAAIAFAGCGRIDFGAIATGDGGTGFGGDGSGTMSSACPIASPVPDPLLISGSTVFYTTFSNATSPIPNTVVSASSSAGPQSTVSDGSGNFELGLPTGGVAQAFTLTVTNPNYFSSTVHPTIPFDRDLTTQIEPLWGASAMDNIYTTGGATRDPSAGTVNIQVLDCSGAPIVGAIISLDPPPAGGVVYLDAGGVPTAGQLGTVAPFATALAFNASAGTTSIFAAATGLTIPSGSIDVVAGTHNELIVLHPSP